VAVDAKTYRDAAIACRPEEVSEAWFRLASYPDRNPGNPHLELLHDALSAEGVRLVRGLRITTDWLDEHATEVDAIHIHWPERIWRGKLRGRLDRVIRSLSLGQIRGVLRLKRFLLRAKRLEIKRIWTVHNLEHHEGSTWVDRWGYRTLMRHSDALIVYAQHAANELAARNGCGERVLVMRHGNYADRYGAPRPRTKVLGELGLDAERPTVCCVGIIRGQKGVDVACRAVARLDGRVQLIVAGESHASFDESQLEAEIQQLPGAVWLRKALDASAFADIVAASDAVLLPYKKVTGSGVLYAAWTLGRGVIASDLPFFREALENYPDAGELFAVGDAEALARAIESYLERPAASRARAVQAANAEQEWSLTVQPLVAMFRRWKGQRVA
jgi:glycosyltransferase involved in cell wall biosynthesis